MQDINEVIEFFRLKSQSGVSDTILNDREFRIRTNQKIWINNPNHALSEQEMKTFLESRVRIKGVECIISEVLSTAEGIRSMDYYAMKTGDINSIFGQYKIHKDRILHYITTNEILPKTGFDLKLVNFEEGMKKERPTKEECLAFLKKIREQRHIVYIDTETTGLYPERGDTAIQVYCLRTFQGKKVSEMKVYIKPYKNAVSQETIDIHHIDEKTIAEYAIGPIDALEKIKAFLETNDNTVIFGHNVLFDMRILQFMFNDWNIEGYSFAHLDTIDMVRTILQRYDSTIKKTGLSYLIENYLKDVNLEETLGLITDFIDRHYNYENKAYNGDFEQFKKDVLGKKRDIMKQIHTFYEKESSNELLFDKDTNDIKGFYDKLVDLEPESNDALETMKHLKGLVKAKIDRRHQADYDTIQTFALIEKMIVDFS